jgi:hypothetical protein
MAEFKAIQEIMGYYDGFTIEMADNEHEAQTTSRDEAKPANKAEHEKQEEALTQENAEPEQHPSLPIIESLSYSSESVLTGVPMTASMTPNKSRARKLIYRT